MSSRATPSVVLSAEDSTDELLVASRPPAPAGLGLSSRAAPAASALQARKLALAALAAITLLGVILLGGSCLLPSPSFAHPRRRQLIHEDEEQWQDLVEIWMTDRTVGKLARVASDVLVPDFDMEGPVVDVFPAAKDQAILGFGGAFTESSAVVFKKLSPDLQEHFLELYFGPEGLGLSMGRVHINSCDFSEAPYNFDEQWNDYNLTFFDQGVAHDAAALIPLIKRANATMQRAGNSLRLLATPWSPPPWMKSNSKMTGSVDYPGGGLLKQARTPWAKYIARWVSAYKAHGVPVWAITVQNEPGFAAPWEACTFTAEEEAEFLGEFLGPTMKKQHPDVAIFMYDHNKDRVYDFAKVGYEHPVARQYIHGVAFHWYSGDQFDNVAAVHRDFPEALLLPSEATYEKGRWNSGVPPENWAFGEGYAHDIIGDLNAGASGWIDWNLLLDARGGPNHLNNFCDASIVADQSGKALHVHPQYYFIGHFSKFILPGSTRVLSEVHGSRVFSGVPRPYGTCTGEDGLEATAAVRPDGKVAVVVLNCGDASIRFKLRVLGKALKALIPPHAIQTFILPQMSELQI